MQVIANQPRLTRFVDFSLRLGEKVMDIEVKYKLPDKAGAQLTRLVSQAESALTVGEGRVVVWTLKEPTVSELSRVTTALGNNANQVQFVNGVTGLFQYIKLYFGL
jgi:hypothetical protein